MIGDWQTGFLRRFQVQEDPPPQERRSDGSDEAEEALRGAIDRIGDAASSLGQNVTAFRIKEPCRRCGQW